MVNRIYTVGYILCAADSLSTYESSSPLQPSRCRPTNHQHLLSLIDVHESTKMMPYRTYTVAESRHLSAFFEIYLYDLMPKPFRYFISTAMLISWKAILNVWYTNSLCAYMLIAPIYKSISLTTNMLG